jgi:hypothetical protein
MQSWVTTMALGSTRNVLRGWSYGVLVAALVIAFPASASADLSVGNGRLDHSLQPQFDPRLVVAGEVVSIAGKREFRFRVAGVILGAQSYRGRTLTIQTAVRWPETLTPFQTGTFCLLVLGQPKRNPRDAPYLCAVVPGRAQEYPRAADHQEAKAILANELLAQLKGEMSERRQRLLLLQLAPILEKDNASAVEEFLTSADEWVRRAALAAVVYATEDQKHLEGMAKDVHEYFRQTQGIDRVKTVDELNREVQTSPRTLLLEDYFFLERRTWTWGSMWNEREAEKHLRILNGMLKCEIMDEAARTWLLEK